MRVYICGPVTNGDTLEPERINANIARFAAVAAHLVRLGHDPVNPTVLPGAGAGIPWPEVMRVCLKTLLDADAIYLLPDWSESRGGRLEQEIAKAIGLPVWSAR